MRGPGILGPGTKEGGPGGGMKGGNTNPVLGPDGDLVRRFLRETLMSPCGPLTNFNPSSFSASSAFLRLAARRLFRLRVPGVPVRTGGKKGGNVGAGGAGMATGGPGIEGPGTSGPGTVTSAVMKT